MRTSARTISTTMLFIFSSVGGALGQGCFNWMIPQYSTYATLSTDGTRIYASVLVDGTTGGTCPSSCDHCSQILTPTPIHTPKAYNLLGSTGGWGTGNGGAWNSYISYTNKQNIAAQSTLVPFLSTGQVICSVAGLLYDVAATEYSATSPNCGNNQVVTVFVPAQTPKCDGTTTYSAASSVTGGGSPYISDISVTTKTDNTLLIDLLGGPIANSFCSNKLGGTWCYNQSYKTAVPSQYTGKT